MATAHDYSQSLVCTAPVGGATVGTVVNVSTATKMVVLPTSSAPGAAPSATIASGALFTGRCEGLVKGVPKLSGTAWVQFQPLAWSTTTTQFSHAVTGALWPIAVAAADATSSATTGDVILRLPIIAAV